ncbi:SRPBCC family protein [Nocardioides sp. NPDC101246]|uniref:SRPBCC family protein n=1 Tax=Nocardioides sp. NPDC101246 TaxID=3364336 RepID=UPI00380D0392
MPSIRSHAVLDHDAATVWATVREVGAVSDWFPAITHSEATDAGRDVTLADGTRLIEETVTLDDALRRYQYRITGGDLVPESHLGTIDVVDLGEGRTVLVYGSDVEPVEVAAAFDGAISEAVAALGGYLDGRA